MSVIASLIAGLFLISGVLLSFGFRKTDKFIQFMMASTLGLGASLIMVELLPDSASGIGEAFNGSHKLLLLLGYIIMGLIIMKICDIFIPDHELKKDNKKNHYLHLALIISLPIMIYNIIVGMKINISSHPFMLSFGLGFCNILFGLLLSGLFSKTLNKKNLIITISLISLSVVIGTLFHMFLDKYLNVTDGLMTLIGTVNLGMIIYVILGELFLNLLKAKDTYITILGIVFGTILLFISHLFYL